MNEILLVYKKSEFELQSSSEDEALRLFANSNHPDAVAMRLSHESQKRSLEEVVRLLDQSELDYRMIYRADLMQLSKKDYRLVISHGGDGTLLEVSHYIQDDLPILGFNSDPDTSKGFYCCANHSNLKELFENIEKLKTTRLNRIQIELNQQLIKEQVLNDVLIANMNPAATTRYRLYVDGTEKRYQNSGLLVCTAAGSTARSYQENGIVMPIDSLDIEYINLGKRGEKPGFASSLEVGSLTKQGRIYIDGPHITYVFSLGDKVLMKRGMPLAIIGDFESKRKEYR